MKGNWRGRTPGSGFRLCVSFSGSVFFGAGRGGWTRAGISLGKQGPVDRPTDMDKKIKLRICSHKHLTEWSPSSGWGWCDFSRGFAAPVTLLPTGVPDIFLFHCFCCRNFKMPSTLLATLKFWWVLDPLFGLVI